MLIDYRERSKKALKEAIVHCIEIMGLKNPDNLTKVSEKSFIHTNTRGRKKLFTAYGTFHEYNSCREAKGKKLHKVMTFYITEETFEPCE